MISNWKKTFAFHDFHKIIQRFKGEVILGYFIKSDNVELMDDDEFW